MLVTFVNRLLGPTKTLKSAMKIDEVVPRIAAIVP